MHLVDCLLLTRSLFRCDRFMHLDIIILDRENGKGRLLIRIIKASSNLIALGGRGELPAQQGGLLLGLLFLLLNSLLFHHMGVVIQSLVELELLHFLAIFYFLVLGDSVEFLAEEVVVGELSGFLVLHASIEVRCGLNRGSSLATLRLIWSLNSSTLNEVLHLTGTRRFKVHQRHDLTGLNHADITALSFLECCFRARACGHGEGASSRDVIIESLSSVWISDHLRLGEVEADVLDIGTVTLSRVLRGSVKLIGFCHSRTISGCLRFDSWALIRRRNSLDLILGEEVTQIGATRSDTHTSHLASVDRSLLIEARLCLVTEPGAVTF